MLPNKHNSPVVFFKLALGSFLLLSVLGLPSGITAWFDGFPWAGDTETIVLSVLIPFLLILGWRFLTLRIPILVLGVLLTLKLVLYLASPSGGWLTRVITPNALDMNVLSSDNSERWVKTYATSWNNNASGILQKAWNNKLDFPLDWALYSNSCNACFHDLALTIEVDGTLVLPKGKKFALIAKGFEGGALSAVNQNGESFNFLPSKSFEEAGQSRFQLLQEGTWQIFGKLKYTGDNWSLIPTLINQDGEISSDLDRDALWQNKEGLAGSLRNIGFYKVLSIIVDSGIILFLLVWTGWITMLLVKNGILNWPLFIFSMMATFVPFLATSFFSKILVILRLQDPTNVSHLGISSILAGAGFLTWVWWKKDFRNFQDDKITPSIFLFFGPAILFFFSIKWWFSLGQWKDWGTGDDWMTYQDLARTVVVRGEWLTAGEIVFYIQPLYRYIVGIYHWLFGQSAFVQNMSDVWCVLGATIIIVGFAKQFRISPLLIFISSIAYLSINLLGAFRYQIGRGLVEYSAMIFMMLAAWFLYRSREGGTKPIILAALFGILAYWTRQDHLGAIAFLVFLVLEPVAGPTGGWKGYWDRFQLHWKKFAVYWGFGIFGPLLICFRHWWLGGVFYPTAKGHPNLEIDEFATRLENIYLTVTTNYWPHFNLSGFVVTFGVIVALLALFWRPNVLKNFPLSLPIIFVGLVLPYAFVMNWGYAPRYSIHLIPLALFSLVIFLNNIFGEFKFLSKFHSNQN